MDKSGYSLCYMCPFHCPINVTTNNSQVKFVESNLQVPGMDELTAWPLVEPGSFLSDFDEKGVVSCSPEPIRWN